MSQRPPIAPRSPRAALEPQQMPRPPKRSERARNPLVVFGNAVMTLLLIVMLGAGCLYVYGKQVLSAKGPLAEEKTVNIPPRAGMTDIGDILQREGVIDVDRWTFIGSVLAMNARSGLKSGEFLFQKNASLSDVINTIVEGKVVQHAFTVPEGLTSEQIVARLQDNDIFAGTLREIPREGTLLPDTYKFPRGTPREQVIQRMQQAQRRVLNEIWERRSPDVPVRTPEQLVILASIVEKETGRADERSRVAAVFSNRLRQKIKLQSDPTIIYGLVGGKGTLGRPIKRSEIQQPTPYNTYVIDGLPPGPIANPGKASLEATANPARTRDLFFVADGTGGHTFTDNYSAHQAAVAKLRSLERAQQNDTVEPDDATPAPGTPAPAAATTPAPAAASPPAPAQTPSTGKKGTPKAAGPKASAAPVSLLAMPKTTNAKPAGPASSAAHKRSAAAAPAASSGAESGAEPADAQ
ncbi:MAG: endolytic transglycosylase MltG [Bradyrhizobiaceae bacterium]|nr:MAG: endolytic transglycosylase MltG [Bradyrhizobiaceae bacterium]